MDHLEDYYKSHDEDSRLLSLHGQVEYRTTQKYIHDALMASGGNRILEIGAGTGCYSIPLAREGYDVTAVDLMEHHLDILRKKLDGSEKITVIQGNALDLSMFRENMFDVTLSLGPMYHFYSTEEKKKALSEAVRVTKPGGYILVAYCMNEPTVIQYVFGRDKLREVTQMGMLTEDWHCISEQKDIFEMIRPDEIAALDADANVERIKLVATDGATNYMREVIDIMDSETFEKWMSFHLATCERQDLVGASNHTLDILKKRG